MTKNTGTKKIFKQSDNGLYYHDMGAAKRLPTDMGTGFQWGFVQHASSTLLLKIKLDVQLAIISEQ